MKQLFHKSQCHFPLQVCTAASLRACIFLVTKHTCPHSSCVFNSSVMVSRCSHHYCGLQLSVNIIQCTEPFCHCRCSDRTTVPTVLITEVNLLKPSSFFTYHKVQHSKILHGAHFALSVLYGYQNRPMPLTA